MLINRHLLQKLADQSFNHRGIYGKIGMKINPVSNPSNRKTTVTGKNIRKMGRVFHSGSGGETLNGSSIAMDDASDTMGSQG